jgi:GT2 family glycosyltransferase
MRIDSPAHFAQAGSPHAAESRASVGAERVQVQIVTHNSASAITACLDAILVQTIPPAHILVIDNASSDDTPRRVLDHPSARADAFEFVVNDRNIGYASAHNQGFCRARAHGMTHVLTLNPDVRLGPDYLELCLAAGRGQARVGAVTGLLLRSDARLVDTAGLCMGPLYHVRDRCRGKPLSDCNTPSSTVWGVCGAAALYAAEFLTDAATALGAPFDDTFFIYKEDVDLCWRGRLLGWTYAYVAEATATHARGWRTSADVSDESLAHSFANQIAILIAYGRRASPIFWAAAVVEAVRFVRLSALRPRAARKAMQYIRGNWRHNWRRRRVLGARSVTAA